MVLFKVLEVLCLKNVYDDQGNMQNATMADYLVPMAYEMPDIIVDHVTTNSGPVLLVQRVQDS